MLTPLTTARKATVSATMAFLSPLTTFLLSGEPVTWRALLASVLLGALGYLATYETTNTEPVERPTPAPVTGRHRAG